MGRQALPTKISDIRGGGAGRRNKSADIAFRLRKTLGRCRRSTIGKMADTALMLRESVSIVVVIFLY